MMVTDKTLILEDNKEYAIVNQFVLDDIRYIYLVDINDNNNIIIGKFENDEIVEMKDKDELEEISNMFYDNLKRG